MTWLCKPALRRSLLGACLAVASPFAVPAHADDWGAFASISTTMGVSGSRICIGEASRGDLGCPAYAPSLTTAGDVSVTGNLSATKFLGDGSGLTNLPTQNVSVTTGASGSLVYRDAYGSLVASSGLSISSTTGSVGIGAGAPASVGNNGFYAAGIIRSAGDLIGPNMGFTNNGSSLYWGDTSTKITGSTSNPYITFTTSSTEAMRIVSTGYVGIGTSSPAQALQVVGDIRSGSSGSGPHIKLTNNNEVRAYGSNSGITPLYLNNYTGAGVRIGGSASVNSVGFGNPSTTLHVFGTLRIADGGESCDTNRTGAIKYVSSDFYICRNGSAWESLTSIATAATPDRITSGTTSLIATNGGSLTTTAPLEVSGTVSATTVQLANNPTTTCSAATDGTLKVVNGRPYICRHTP